MNEAKALRLNDPKRGDMWVFTSNYGEDDFRRPAGRFFEPHRVDTRRRRAGAGDSEEVWRGLSGSHSPVVR